MELAADLTPAGLRDVLAELGDRVAPVSLARERTLPVPSAMLSLFPDGGLVRGRIHACGGGGATTMAMAMVGEALVAGSWMAVVDLPTFGAAAANELGVPLERVVRIDSGRGAAGGPGGAESTGEAVGETDPAERLDRWFDVMAAAIDGFDVILARVPDALGSGRRQGAVRSLVARLQQRGSIAVVIGQSAGLPVDVTVATSGVWSGLGQGYGVLQRRRLHAAAEGRRLPRRSTVAVDLDVSGSRLAIRSATPDAVSDVPGRGVSGADGGAVRLIAG